MTIYFPPIPVSKMIFSYKSMNRSGKQCHLSCKRRINGRKTSLFYNLSYLSIGIYSWAGGRTLLWVV